MDMAKKKTEPKKEAKAVTTASVKSEPIIKENGLREVELIKDHGRDVKGDKLVLHPNMAQLLIDRKIAK